MIDASFRGISERRLPRGEQAQALVDGFRPRFGQDPDRLQDGFTQTTALAQDYRQEVQVRRGDADRNLKLMVAGMGALLVGAVAAPLVGPALFVGGTVLTGVGMFKSLNASSDVRELEWTRTQLEHKAGLYEDCLQHQGYLIASN